MALKGCLEDLGICDILQVLGLSKKTGILTLNGAAGGGEVSFLDGQVIRASSTLFPEALGQLLCKSHLVTAEQVAEALALQRTLASHQPLGHILIELFHIPAVEVEKVIAAQIERIVLSFFSWTEGYFSFQLEDVKSFDSARLNPLDFMLEHGLSSQRLVVKGSKLSELGCENDLDESVIDREIDLLKVQQGQCGLDLLRGMLAELEHPELGGGIILLILRYASELMDRAIVFDVRGNQLVGLGQFGLDDLNIAAAEIVRKMRLQVEPGSLFAQVLRDKIAVRSVLKNTAAEECLKEFLHGVSEKVFVAPLVSDGKVVALLYGDNFLLNRPLPAVNAFEVFLSQAGVAMEQALQGID